MVIDEPEGKVSVESRVNVAYPIACTKLLLALIEKLVKVPMVAE